MDLHPLMGAGTSTIEFRVIRRGQLVQVDVAAETLNLRFGVADRPYGLLQAYEAHRASIDRAVLRRADECREPGVIHLRPTDLWLAGETH